jgi:hypothetical protein
MSNALGRKDWIRRLVQQAAESTPMPASGERVKELGPQSVRPEDRRLAKRVAGVVLDAWITDDMQLGVDVEVEDGWTPLVEKALYEALDADHSLVSGLLLWEWNDLKRLCAQASERARSEQLAARMADCA